MTPAPVAAEKSIKSAAAHNFMKDRCIPVNKKPRPRRQDPWLLISTVQDHLRPAIASISIPAPLGRSLTAKQDLAG